MQPFSRIMHQIQKILINFTLRWQLEKLGLIWREHWKLIKSKIQMFGKLMLIQSRCLPSVTNNVSQSELSSGLSDLRLSNKYQIWLSSCQSFVTIQFVALLLLKSLYRDIEEAKKFSNPERKVLKADVRKGISSLISASMARNIRDTRRPTLVIC